MILLLPISGPVTQAAVWKHKISQRIVSILFCGKCRSSSFLYCGCKVLTRTTRFADQYVWRTFPLLCKCSREYGPPSSHDTSWDFQTWKQYWRCEWRSPCEPTKLYKHALQPKQKVPLLFDHHFIERTCFAIGNCFSIFSFKCGPRLAWQPAGPKMVCEMPLGNLGGQRSKLQVFRAPARRSFLPMRWRWKQLSYKTTWPQAWADHLMECCWPLLVPTLGKEPALLHPPPTSKAIAFYAQSFT